MTNVKQEFLEFYERKPERIIFSEATVSPQNKMEKSLYNITAQNTGSPVAGQTAVDAVRRVKKMGLNPINIIRHLSGASGKAKGPLKFLIAYRPFAGPFRDTRFVLGLTLKRYSGNQVRWGTETQWRTKPGSRSTPREPG